MNRFTKYLEEGSYTIGGMRFFDKIDQISSNHWGNLGMGKSDMRIIYLPEHSRFFIANPNKDLHAQMILALSGKYIKEGDSVTAGFVVKKKVNGKDEYEISFYGDYYSPHGWETMSQTQAMEKMRYTNFGSLTIGEAKKLFPKLFTAPVKLIYREETDGIHAWTEGFHTR